MFPMTLKISMMSIPPFGHCLVKCVCSLVFFSDFFEDGFDLSLNG